MSYVWVVAVFAKQVEAQGRDREYLSQVYARYFARWPVSLTPDLAREVTNKKEVSRVQSNTANKAPDRSVIRELGWNFTGPMSRPGMLLRPWSGIFYLHSLTRISFSLGGI